MNAKKKLLCLAVVVSLASMNSEAPAQENLPQPDPTFHGNAGQAHLFGTILEPSSATLAALALLTLLAHGHRRRA